MTSRLVGMAALLLAAVLGCSMRLNGQWLIKTRNVAPADGE